MGVHLIARAGTIATLLLASLGGTSTSAATDIGQLRRDDQGHIVIVPAVPNSNVNSAPPVPAPSPLPAPGAPSKAPPTATAPKASPSLGSAQVTGIAVTYHDGQTFVTWTDAAVGAEGQKFRYTIYRATDPITEASLASAQRIAWGVVNASGELFGTDFSPAARLDPNQPMATIRENAAALPRGSGLWIHTAKSSAIAFYAVVASDFNFARLSKIIPGENATTTGIHEEPAPLRPIKLYDARERPGTTAGPALISLHKLPLMLKMHASESSGGAARPVGDYYLYFGNEAMGYRDGMPGVFSVEDVTTEGAHRLELFTRDAILKPDGLGALETYWFGYFGTPQWAPNTPPHAYPFTEERLLWLVDWTAHRYDVDLNRIYATGYSMGGWGSTTFALRHPEIFAAIYPMMPRPRQRGLTSLVPRAQDQAATMPDGQDYFTRMDMVRFVQESKGELPFMAWSIGRHDGYASWKDQLDMVRAMAMKHRGFAFAWNNGDHGAGPAPMHTLLHYYPFGKFSLAESYPAFSHSSIDADPGDGDPEHGDKEGGINLGFAWETPNETATSWTVKISNDLATHDMTVDVTPRRMQHFHPTPRSVVRWQSSTGGAGTVVVDDSGFVTIPKVTINPGQRTALTIGQ